MIKMLWILAALFILFFEAPAQNFPRNMEEVLAALDSTSPVLAAARTELSLARAELTVSRALPNPTFFVEQEQLSNSNTEIKETQLGARQELGFLWSLPSRVSAARNAYQAGLLAYSERRRDLEVEVLTTTFLVVAQLHQLALLDTVLALGHRLEEVASARKQAGEISGFDVERVRIEVLELKSERAVLAAAYGESLGTLIHFTGLPAHVLTELRFPAAFDPPFTSADEAAQYALKNRPLVTQSQHELASARRALSAARWNMLPNFSLGFSQKSAEQDLQGTIWEVELEVPLFQQRRSALSVLRARREQAELNRTSQEYRIEQEARSAYAEWQALRQTELDTTDVLADHARRNVDNALTLYTEGKLSALELVDALRTGFEAYTAATEIRARQLTAALHLRHATGLPIWE